MATATSYFNTHMCACGRKKIRTQLNGIFSYRTTIPNLINAKYQLNNYKYLTFATNWFDSICLTGMLSDERLTDDKSK